MADQASKVPAPYVPQSVTASERMANSLISRSSPMTTLEGYQPSAVVQAGMRTRETPELASPLWGMLPPVTLEPVVAALESALGVPAEKPVEKPQPRDAAAEAPRLTLVQSPSRPDVRGNVQSEAQPTLSQTAIDASTKLLDALRAHASAQASLGGSGRVSLSDMQTISFAEKNNRLAAAAMNESVPESKEPDTCHPEFPNPKIYNDQNDYRHKVQEVAQKLLKEESDDQDMADTRFGDA